MDESSLFEQLDNQSAEISPFHLPAADLLRRATRDESVGELLPFTEEDA
jgi:hypothetical protein